jgi:hydrogenase maturation protease
MTTQTKTILEVEMPDTERQNGNVLILGLGNILFKDEGFGAWVALELLKMELPANIEVIDAGTASLDLLLSAENMTKLIIIDVLKSDGEPGAVYKLKFDGKNKEKLNEIFCENQTTAISLHQVGLLGALAAAEKIGNCPKEIVIIGIEPDDISFGLGLTDKLRNMISKTVNIVLEELGYAVHRK